MYQIRILDAASRELGRLEADVRRRIVGRVHWLAENLDVIKPEALLASSQDCINCAWVTIA